MRKILFLIVLLCAFVMPTIADDAVKSENPSIQTAEPAVGTKVFNTFEKGDGILTLALGAAYPLGFSDPYAKQGKRPNSYPGFSFSIFYTGFLTSHWTLSGDVSGSFINTINGERLFLAPISIRAGYAFTIQQFTIMPSAGLGLAVSSLGEYNHVDMLMRFGGSFMWKASHDMSYDFNLFFNIIPQIFTKYPENTRVGFFAETTIALSYYL